MVKDTTTSDVISDEGLFSVGRSTFFREAKWDNALKNQDNFWGNLCKTSTRKYEQAGIEKGGFQKDGGLENLINSISKKNPKYKDYIKEKEKHDSFWDELFWDYIKVIFVQ